jgi:predicted lactoylglutathione lyase
MLRWSDEVALMVTAKAFFEMLAHRPAGDPRTATTAAFGLSFDSRAEVDAMTEKALAAGGREVHPPEDEGFMYSRAFEDPDGHAFGPMWMDVEAGAAAGQEPATA